MCQVRQRETGASMTRKGPTPHMEGEHTKSRGRGFCMVNSTKRWPHGDRRERARDAHRGTKILFFWWCQPNTTNLCCRCPYMSFPRVSLGIGLMSNSTCNLRGSLKEREHKKLYKSSGYQWRGGSTVCVSSD